MAKIKSTYEDDIRMWAVELAVGSRNPTGEDKSTTVARAQAFYDFVRKNG